MTTDFNEQYWEKHYQKSGENGLHFQPSSLFVAEVEHLKPGTALDAGCGEGADAIWLAKNGWQVTAVDISQTALSKASDLAKKAEVEVDWQQADLTTGTPEKNQFDLVVSEYVHTTDQDAFYKKLAQAVKTGGTLFITGHQPPKEHEVSHHAEGSHVSAEQIAANLDASQWDIEVAEPRDNERTAPNGKTFRLIDSVLKARKK
jgi:2-polyprenyl-3-methyl-5-hydroxy-6-metoxy-1,4-benzoquinol methylase